ncbi:cytochrome c [Labilibaculum sp.]|uniref:c-type cytochrome n=1 Tax=Labilibaculum sp. TaxID=2060723 RepID=UPI002AA5FDBF|nr:cytochrome c [Labilibaculum sp.]MBN2596017.1 c-type cytochrome [Marinifilaceae bacterium]
MKNAIKIIASLFLVFTFSTTVVKAEEWSVPASAKKKQNPYEASTKNISSGKKVYNINCKSCHGDATMGNMLPLQPVAPSDLGSQAFLMQTDGEIYYKVNKGNGAMPTFEKTLSDEDKWMVITYLRSFDQNKKVSKKIAEVINPEVSDVKILLDINKEDKRITANLSGLTKKGDRAALQGIELSIKVKRSFGYLDISGDDAYTNEKGEVNVQFPEDLPGDREGHVNLLVKVTDDAYYGEVNVDRIVSLGLPTNPVNPLDERAMWGTRANAPIWIILSYVGGVISIWGVIFLVLFQLIQLPKLAKNKE